MPSRLAIAFCVCVFGYVVGAGAAVISPKPTPTPTMPCLRQSVDDVIIIDCSIRKGAHLETPAPAGNTFRHGVWIIHVNGPLDGSYSYRP